MALETPPPSWERGIIEELALEAIKEKRRARRWGIFFKILLAVYLVAILAVPLMLDGHGGTKLKLSPDGKHTALVELKGVISDDDKASADNVVTGLRDAFEDKATKGVVLRINSPGGSPVQSSYINKEIKRLREKYPDTPLYAVVADICASGGYYVAVAADKIYVNESSLVGSIGVRMDSFGLVDALDKLGIERRLLTAGEHKGIADPFLPLSDGDKSFVLDLLSKLHQEFIAVVKEGRGDRLKPQPDLFSGLFWTGKDAVKMGLADDFGSAGSVARDVIGAENIVDFTYKERTLDQLLERLGAGAMQGMAKILGMSDTPVMAK